MYELKYLIVNILHIALLNVILSFDSISVIALLTRKLPKRFAKKANITGISLAVICTILFASIISVIMEIEWLPIQLIGGFLLIKITYDLLRSDFNNEAQTINSNEQTNIQFIIAIFKIALASLTLSFDNILAIAGAADGNVLVISNGLLISLPFILFSSQYIIGLIKRNHIFKYISGAMLIYTALEMIFSYKYLSSYIPKLISQLLPIIFAGFVILYGIYIVKFKDSNNRPSICETDQNDL
jgi:YjbE family integral membrane protein